jgi:hypothetical protein
MTQEIFLWGLVKWAFGMYKPLKFPEMITDWYGPSG